MIEDKQKQMRNGVYYFTAVAFSGLIPLITLPLFTRFLSPGDYGVLALAQIWAALLSGIAQFGLGTAYERNFFKYRTDHDLSAKLLYSTVLSVVLSSIIFIYGTHIFQEEVADFLTGESKNGQIVLIALCATVVTGLNVFYLNFFRNSENAKSFVAYTVGISVVAAMVGVVLVVIYEWGVIGLVYAQLITALLFFIVINVLLMQTLPLKLDYKIVIEALKIGYPLTFKSLFSVLNQQFDKYMIGLLSTLGGVGIYSIAQKISYMVFMFLNAIQNVYSPRVYREMFDNKKNGGVAIGHYLTPFLYLSLFPCVLLATFGQEVVELLLPEPFHAAGEIIPILAMYYGFMFFGKVIPLQFMYAKKAWILTLLLVMSVLLNVGINIPFILEWGAVGAAWATLIASVISTAIGFTLAQKYYHIGWENMRLASMLFITVFLVALSLTLGVIGLSIGVTISIKIVIMGAYMLLGNKLGILTLKNIVLLKESLLPHSGK